MIIILALALQTSITIKVNHKTTIMLYTCQYCMDVCVKKKCPETIILLHL